jgi:hypothetical protein
MPFSRHSHEGYYNAEECACRDAGDEGEGQFARGCGDIHGRSRKVVPE